jgi:hypothetical protein
MPRLMHGAAIPLQNLLDARNELASRSAANPFAFAVAGTVDFNRFDFLFPELQDDPDNLLPESQTTRDALVALGRAMVDLSADATGDSNIPAAYTYLGQFIDHDITLESEVDTLPNLLDPALVPLSRADIKARIRNIRTATLDLDSVYGLPAPQNGEKMLVGPVTSLSGTEKPLLRPPGKGNDNDLPREGRSTDFAHDRAALIGDPRNDENTIVAQLHVAFLRAHNALVDQGHSFSEARTLLRQHYQHLVIHDFLKRVADPAIVDTILKQGNQVYDSFAEPFFMPLEYSFAVYRFGHSMIRKNYDFNLNFNTSGDPGTLPASLGLLFTFSALSGQLGDFDTLPDNWIIEWERLVETRTGVLQNKARRIDTQLVEPLFELTDEQGKPVMNGGDGARLAVRNLLRGYLLRMPTGQAVARALQNRLGAAAVPILEAAQLQAAAETPEQIAAIEAGGFGERTPLWYYVLAEAKVTANGSHLGPVGSWIIAEVLIGLIRRSDDSILRSAYWQPTLPSAQTGTFTLPDLLRLAGVLTIE